MIVDTLVIVVVNVALIFVGFCLIANALYIAWLKSRKE